MYTHCTCVHDSNESVLNFHSLRSLLLYIHVSAIMMIRLHDIHVQYMHFSLIVDPNVRMVYSSMFSVSVQSVSLSLTQGY